MPISPIDMQAPVQRSADAVQASNNAARRPEHMHQQFAERLQREAGRNDKQVRQPNRPEEADGRESRRDSGRGPAKGKDREKKEAALRALKSGNLVDVKV